MLAVGWDLFRLEIRKDAKETVAANVEERRAVANTADCHVHWIKNVGCVICQRFLKR